MTVKGTFSAAWRGRAGSFAALLALGLLTGGCASTVADLPVVGAPAGLPARPAQPGEYLPVHDIPTARKDDVMLDQKQQAQIEADLIKARDRQAVATPAAKAAKPKSSAN